MADHLAHSTDKTLKDSGDKVPAADKQAVEAALNDLREAVKGEDIAAIRAKIDTLNQVAMKMGEALYKNEQAGAAGAAPGAEAKPQEGVVDAEFTEVKDDKKQSGS
jgi:molecular chaperone DnaK